MTGPILHHADILPPGAVVALARATLSPSRPRHLHGHDFHEFLWVQNGTLRHHLPDGRSDIAEGGLLILRPGDTHALQGRGTETLVVSLTIHPDLVDALAARHPALARFLLSTPALHRRDSHQLAALNRAANLLDLSPRDTLSAEAFLLPLLSDLIAEQGNAPADAPGWLRAACAAAREPAVFREGAAGLVHRAGRAHPHVSRSMRRFYGQSPSEYVNAQRMAYAARRLSGTGDTLTEIAADCGIPNLSHFHKLFRAVHGTTPHQWRRTHQSDVLAP